MRTFKKSTTRKVYRKKRTYKPKVTTAIKKYVKNTIHKNVENKKYIVYAAVQDLSTPTGAFTLMPTLVQGVGSSQRIGNSVRIMSAKLNIIFRLKAYNATTNPNPCPVWVRWYVLKQKLTNSSTFNPNDFFQINNSSQGFTGQAIDLLFPVNSDVFQIYRTGTFKLGLSAQNPTNFPQANCYFDNSPYTKMLSIPYGKYCKQALKFDDTVNNIPTNTNLWFLAQAVPCTGNAIVGSMVQFDMSYNLSYEDA